MMIYCVEHEEVVDAQETPVGFGHGILEEIDTGTSYSFRGMSFCEFPQGFTFCSPPPSLIEELDSMNSDDYSFWCWQNDPALQTEALI